MVRIGLAFALLNALNPIVQIGFGRIMNGLLPGWYYDNFLYFAVCLLPGYLIAMPVCWLVLQSVEKDPPLKAPLGAKNFFCVVAVSLAAIELGGLVGNWISAILGFVVGRDLTNDVSDLILSSDLGTVFLFVCVLAPIMEELFFRKLLLDRVRRYGDRAAILISALAFGLYHGNFYQFFYAFALGAVFAYVYLRTGKLRWTVGFHAGVNFLGSIAALVLSDMVDLNELIGITDAEDALAFFAENAAGLLLNGLYALLLLGGTLAGIIVLAVRWKKLVLRPAVAAMPDRDTARRVFVLNAGVLLYLVSCLFFFARSIFA